MILHDAYGFPVKDGVVPVSDGAGEVVAVGAGVSRWRAGDRVMAIFSQGHQDGAVTDADGQTALGGAVDGMAREFVALPEHGVVRIPARYSFAQAAALPCAAVTAWNALYGLAGRQLMPGHTVVTQGTGGVSLFAVQVGLVRSGDERTEGRRDGGTAGRMDIKLTGSSPRRPARASSRRRRRRTRRRSCAGWARTTS